MRDRSQKYTIQLDDGGEYHGTLDDEGLMDGMGTVTYLDEFCAEGTFKNGERQGYWNVITPEEIQADG